jgi:RNA polymerase sigma-70 factor (ECF subfamily)
VLRYGMELQKTEDIDLMALVGRGRKGAFIELVHRHQSPLLNFFRKMGADTGTAEDLVQETFLRLFNYRDRYQPKAKFTTFLYTLARHARVDRLRKMQRSPRTEGDLESVERPADGEADTDGKLDLRTALGGLSEKLRSVVVMSVYQGLKYQEIGEILEIPVGTVKSRMHLAVRELKGLLDAE